MADLLSKESVFFDNPSATVDEVLEFLSQKAVELGLAGDKTQLLEAFKARESQGSTGMVGGFALPHAKSAAVSHDAVMVVKFAHELDWKSMDNKPIKAAIAILTPADSAGAHLAVLAKIAAMLMQPAFCETILTSQDADEIVRAINDRINE